MTSSYATAMVLSKQPLDAIPPRTRGFLLGYSLAQAGAFISFIPLLTLLLPLKADGIAGDDRALLLSQAAMVGGLVAAVANMTFGFLSDRQGSWGRRRSWILLGLPAVALALAAIGASTSPIQLILALVFFQLAINAVYAPLTALVPDMVPDRQKGTISALATAALPVANIFTALVVVGLSGSLGAQFAIVIVVTCLLILPFGLMLREPVVPAEPVAGRRFSLTAFQDFRFRVAFLSRLLAESGVAIHTLFLLFLLQGHPIQARPLGWSVLEAFSALLVISTVAATLGGLVAGPLSDRVGRRSPFVIAGAVGMAVALAILALGSTWPVVVIGQLLFGVFHGVHSATVAAMNAEIVSSRSSGRDLGVMNLAIALPQSLAPALAAVLLTTGVQMTGVFVVAGCLTLAAALSLVPILQRA